MISTYLKQFLTTARFPFSSNKKQSQKSELIYTSTPWIETEWTEDREAYMIVSFLERVVLYPIVDHKIDEKESN